MSAHEHFSAALMDELHAFALRLTGHDSDAWDLVQDTMERALRKWPTKITHEAVGAWFRVVLRNRHLDMVRSSAHRLVARATLEMLEDLPAPESTDLPLWRRVDPEVLSKALPRLSAEQRQVLVMQWRESMSLRDIATKLGIPQATVGVRAHRARKSLRRLLLDEPRGADNPGGPKSRRTARVQARGRQRFAAKAARGAQG